MKYLFIFMFPSLLSFFFSFFFLIFLFLFFIFAYLNSIKYKFFLNFRFHRRLTLLCCSTAAVVAATRCPPPAFRSVQSAFSDIAVCAILIWKMFNAFIPFRGIRVTAGQWNELCSLWAVLNATRCRCVSADKVYLFTLTPWKCRTDDETVAIPQVMWQFLMHDVCKTLKEIIKKLI